MTYRIQDIAYENGPAWVLTDKKGSCYIVFVAGVTHSTSDSAYELSDDGLSIAKARADYLAARPARDAAKSKARHIPNTARRIVRELAERM